MIRFVKLKSLEAAGVLVCLLRLLVTVRGLDMLFWLGMILWDIVRMPRYMTYSAGWKTLFALVFLGECWALYRAFRKWIRK